MFQLTTQERKVVIFILCLLILGIGADFLKKKISKQNFVNYEELQDKLIKKVDINKTTFSELRTIPGMGEKLAKRIIDYRSSHGGFKDVEELKQIKGIKDKKLERIRKYIILSQ
mgnify:CR=1 FL=1